ncbi:replication protein A 70 kDa DNA-binding subunit B [Tanacetum coccineum]
MQAQVRMKLVNRFKDHLKEGSAVTLEGYSLGEIQLKFHMVNKALRLSFLSSTKVEPCPDFSGSFYGFNFRGYIFITDLQQEEDGQFDVIGHVITCEDLDMGNELQCTLWSAFAQQFNELLNTCTDHGKIIFVLQLAMMKIWDGKMCVQIGYNATKLFLFDATQPIVNEEFQDVKEYSSRFFAREDVEDEKIRQYIYPRPLKTITRKLFMLLTFPLMTASRNYCQYTVLRLSDDPEILDSIQLAVTPINMDTEATNSTLPNITSLTDENTTPMSTQKKNVVDHVEQQDASDGKNKHAAKNDIGNESSNEKKKVLK